jgi:hypothetical protein
MEVSCSESQSVVGFGGWWFWLLFGGWCLAVGSWRWQLAGGLNVLMSFRTGFSSVCSSSEVAVASREEHVNIFFLFHLPPLALRKKKSLFDEVCIFDT